LAEVRISGLRIINGLRMINIVARISCCVGRDNRLNPVIVGWKYLKKRAEKPVEKA